MAIEYQVKGELELADNLKHLLLETLGDLAREDVPESEGVVFRLLVPTVSVTGFSSGRRKGSGEDAALFFRVLDKARVVEAIDLVTKCVGALFRKIEGDLSFWNDDVLLLKRHGRQLRFYEPSNAKDRPFWTVPRRQLMEGPEG